jgi:hypothetical protein
MTERDAGYFRKRLTEERERALRAATRETSAVHRAFARVYQQRLEGERRSHARSSHGNGVKGN